MSAGIVEKVKRIIFDLQDFFFEKWHGLEFSGIVTQQSLITKDVESVKHATAYHAVWCRNLRFLRKKVCELGYFPKIFVDIGSGKGKACLYFFLKGFFVKYIGVEFSPPLVLVANRNKKILRADAVSFVEGDASRYYLPDEDCFVFLFNPFGPVILREFVMNNIEHFKTRRSIIAYANDLHNDVLLESGFSLLFRDETRKLSVFSMK